MRSAARRLDMTYAAHVMAWRGPSCPPLVSTRVGHRVCRGRLLESNARLSRQQRAFASDASSTAPDHAVPVMHLLTSYDLDTAPEVRVTPLKLQGPGSDASLGAKLWREVRLAREVRSKGGGGIGSANCPPSWSASWIAFAWAGLSAPLSPLSATSSV